ncbi:MAG TPA: NFACT RNA binding domain-containing protein [Rectinemataceae bacterium]
MNYKEIDLVLRELDLEGSKIQRVFQPSYDTMVFELFAQGRRFNMLVSLSPGACRIHRVESLPAKNERPLRFMECLRSRIVGFRIAEARQLGFERIVILELIGPSAEGGIGLARYSLFIRLWSGAGNILLTNGDGVIVDALFRKPGKGEASGLPCPIRPNLWLVPDEELKALAERFSIRDFTGYPSLSERIEADYSATRGELSREQLLKKARERHAKLSAKLAARKAELDGQSGSTNESPESLRRSGEALLSLAASSGGGGKPFGERFARFEDTLSGQTLSIQVDPRLSLVESAQKCFERAKKASSWTKDREEQRSKLAEEERKLDAWLERLLSEQDPFAIAQALRLSGTARQSQKASFSCLRLEWGGWTIYVGRSAAENDELLRKAVRGSDLWLHARDKAGSYVFVKSRKDKTIPLDIMLDAARLAIYYSKARKDMKGDVHCTFVKYLKRAKGGPKGLVIPSQEKNLYVRVEEQRIRALLSTSQGESHD